MERKLLGLSQTRLGPNKVSLYGILQPVADGVKLLLKQLFYIRPSQLILFFLGPLLLIIFFTVVWIWLIPWEGAVYSIKYSSLIFFSILGVRAYAVILTGWSSSRRFSKLGSLRGILQNLSFEVALILMFICILELTNSFSIKRERNLNFELLLRWRIIWLILSLMERNRAPFDLLEGERELIRGFNIEIGRLTFVYLFLREYGIIIVLRLITRVGLFGQTTTLRLLFTCCLLFVRRCFPRIRYDVIIRLMWQSVLPLGIFIFIQFWFF